MTSKLHPSIQAHLGRLIASGGFLLVMSDACLAEAPPSPYPIFRDQGILKGVTIEAPLSDLFEMARAATKDDRDIPKEKLPTGKVTLRNADGTSVTHQNVVLSVRGNSSKRPGQCAFAKLSLRFPKGGGGSVMGGLTKIKIGTHCGETEVPGEGLRRLRNQKAPIREALIYKVLSRSDTISLLARPAVITYVDTSTTVNPDHLPAQTITRNAFFLEDEDTAADRYGGKILQKSGDRPPNAPFVNAQDSRIDPVNLAFSVLAQALTGNGDWFLQMSASDPEAQLPVWTDCSNWNVHIMQTVDGRAWSLVYDWDLSEWVTNEDFASLYDFSIRRLAANPDVKQEHLDKAIHQYVVLKAQIYKDVEDAFAQSEIEDAVGKKRILQQLDSFYDEIVRSPSLARGPPAHTGSTR